MRDLRKQALESHKTMSRKARSKQGTPSSSRANSVTPSRNGSRVPSTNASDDEGDFSDDTQWSVASIDSLIAPAAEEDLPAGAWQAFLGDRINEICDRKRSSVQGREDCLNSFNATLTRHFARDEISGKLDELLPAILKSVKSGGTEKETVFGLKALALILITDPSDTIYDLIADPIKKSITDAGHRSAKIAAIRALSVATFYGGASEDETANVMEFLLEIVTTDGGAVEEADDPEIVIAALEEWSFLATVLDDVEDLTEEAMDAFVDQLESSDVGVQIAAGDNIALLYEKSHTEIESDEEVSDHDSNSDEEGADDGPRMVKRYTVYRQQHQLEQTLTALAKASSKRLSKKDRKSLHLAFNDVLHTVEKPTRGPRYSTALDEEGREFGSRLKVAMPGGGKMTIDAWWKLHRLNAMKRVLQSGFLTHYEENQVVFDTLPVAIEDD